MLLDFQRDSFHDIMIFHESWFDRSRDYENGQPASLAEPPEREKKTIASPKLTLSIAWNPSGFRFVDGLPKDLTFHGPSFANKILAQIVVHADSYRPHLANAIQNGINDIPLRLHSVCLIQGGEWHILAR
jgi:hypothetical protein